MKQSLFAEIPLPPGEGGRRPGEGRVINQSAAHGAVIWLGIERARRIYGHHKLSLFDIRIVSGIPFAESFKRLDPPRVGEGGEDDRKVFPR